MAFSGLNAGLYGLVVFSIEVGKLNTEYKDTEARFPCLQRIVSVNVSACWGKFSILKKDN